MKIKLIIRYVLISAGAAFLLWGMYVATQLGLVPIPQLSEVAYRKFGSRGFVAVISGLAFYPGMFCWLAAFLTTIGYLGYLIHKGIRWIFSND